MKHHSKELETLLKSIATIGHTVERRNGKVKILSKNGQDQYTVHVGERAIHPLRRAVQKWAI